MRRVRYQVAMSLDGYIAGPHGEADWIIMDPDIDFEAHFAKFDTVLIGRHSFHVLTGGKKNAGGMPGTKTFVFSSSLRPADYPAVTIVSENADKVVSALRAEPGKDIWLFGGGKLFGSLLEAGLVDSVEVVVVPVLLGGGVLLFSRPNGGQTKLKLTSHKVHEKTGLVELEYSVV
jgi:dihydrofolate reductase